MQTYFELKEKSIPKELLSNFQSLLKEIIKTLEEDLENKTLIDNLLLNEVTLKSDHLKNKESPENYTRTKIIDKILRFLGYSEKEIHRATNIPTGQTRREADYKIIIDAIPILVEAEPLNKNLTDHNTGINQVKEWLENKRSGDYGFATNGIKWILIKFNKNTKGFSTLEETDLTSLYTYALKNEKKDTDDLHKIFNKFYISFAKKHILDKLEETNYVLKTKEEIITKKFYKEYMRYVFGIENDQKLTTSLVSEIKAQNATEFEKSLFSLITMNRIIFIKFLQDKDIVEKNFLQHLIDEYKTQSSPLQTFYVHYLKPLFYEVFNKNQDQRQPFIKNHHLFKDIPYLNGGLFSKTEIPNEEDFDINNDILYTILGTKFLGKYNFTLNKKEQETDLDPDILGNVFEKTINYITQDPNSDKRKEEGAYYTPTTITSYICKETITRYIFEQSMNFLEKEGWKKSELKDYENLDLFLSNLPPNPITVKKLYDNVIKEIKILDPACGSGHFLKDALDRLVKINLIFYQAMGQPIDNYELKKHVVITNIYGVDKDPNAVEIAKLRIWLSLIEDIDSSDRSRIKALPNIEYNIRAGNSLIGKTTANTNGALTEFIALDIKEQIKLIEDNYPNAVEEILKLSEKPTIPNIISIKEILVHLYRKEETIGVRTILKRLIEQISTKLRETLDNLYLGEINSKFTQTNNGKRKNAIQINKGMTPTEKSTFLKETTPFHWNFEFHEAINTGGFNIVIGNPPYGNLLTTLEKKAMFNYKTINASEIAANFVEKALELTKKEGYMGLLLTNGIAINSSTAEARKLIRKNISKCNIALFGTRPAKLFADADIRVLILIGKKDTPLTEGIIHTTQEIKFTSEQKETILDNLRFESTNGLILGKEKIGDNLEDMALPKLGYSLTRSIMLKLKEQSKATFKEKINESYGKPLQFRKTGRYWLNALEKMPYISTKIETIKLETESERDFSIILINSSLFYLYWATYGNSRDFTLGLLRKFPFPPKEILSKESRKISSLKNSLTMCLTNSFTKKGSQGEFKTSNCKQTIDNIDDFLSTIYGLNSEETTFIKQYDSTLRHNTQNPYP